MAKKTEEEKRREKIEAAWKTLTEAERKKLEAYAAHRGMSLDDYLDEQMSRAEDINRTPAEVLRGQASTASTTITNDLKLADLEAYYRDQLEQRLTGEKVYVNPNATADDLAAMDKLDAQDYNRFLNAWLAIRQEMGEDLSSDPDVWKYIQRGQEKGWDATAVGESGIDFDAIAQGYRDYQAREESSATSGGVGGGSLANLWLPKKLQDEDPDQRRAYNGGVIDGHYVPAGNYTKDEYEELLTSPYNRVGEDGLTGGQRLIQQQQKRKEEAQEEAQKRREEEQARRTQEMLAGLITSTDPATGNAAERNMTKAWITNDEQVKTQAANDPTRYQYGGKIPTAESGTNTSADAVMAALASAETAASSGSGRSSAGRAGGTGLSSEEKAQYGRDAYTSLLDAMARGMANTGGMTNTAALQAANAVYDAYAKEPELKGVAESAYSRYLGDSSSRAGERRYTWLNRAQNGGYGTTMPQTSAPAGTQTSAPTAAAPTPNPGAVTPTMPTVGKRPAWQQGGQNIRDTIAGLLARKYAGTGGERNREDIYTRLSRLIRR